MLQTLVAAGGGVGAVAALFLLGALWERRRRPPLPLTYNVHLTLERVADDDNATIHQAMSEFRESTKGANAMTDQPNDPEPVDPEPVDPEPAE